jgi:hypothetical protein
MCLDDPETRQKVLPLVGYPSSQLLIKITTILFLLFSLFLPHLWSEVWVFRPFQFQIWSCPYNAEKPHTTEYKIVARYKDCFRLWRGHFYYIVKRDHPGPILHRCVCQIQKNKRMWMPRQAAPSTENPPTLGGENLRKRREEIYQSLLNC